MRYLRIAIVVLASLAWRAGGDSVTEIPFEFRDGFIWIKVTVPQSSETLNFVVDTGAGISTLNLHTAQRLSLTSGHRVTVRGVQSEVAGFWPQPLTAFVGEVKLPREFLVTDLCQLEDSCQCPVNGLLGGDFFRGRVVQIDFAASTLRLLKSAQLPKGGESIPIRLRRNAIQVQSRVNGRAPQWMRLDTGCASALQWVAPEASGAGAPSKLAIGLTEVCIPSVQTTICLGTHRFERVATGLHQQPIFEGEAGLLGNGLLSRFNSVTVDLQNRRLVLGAIR